MSNQYLSFDVTKQSEPQQLITGRQGDSQLKFVSILFWDGEKNIPYDLTGKQVVFEALKPDGTHIVDTAGITILNATGGLVRYSFNEQVFAVAGTMQQAFFKITQTDSQNNVITDSTLEINIHVLENSVEFGINSNDYLSEYDKLVVDVEKKFDDYTATVQKDITQAQAIHDQIVECTNLINSNAVITKSEFGDVGLIKQPVGATAVDKLNNEFGNRGINVKWFGAVGDGTSDDTNAIQKAIDSLGDSGGLIYIPGGTFKISELKVTKPHVRIAGHGILLDGQLTVGIPEDATLQSYYFEIDGITFEYTKLTENNIGIKMQMSRDGIVRNCYFINCDKSLYVPPIVTGHEQHCARWKIHDNTFMNVNYGLYVDRNPNFVGDGFTVGDFNFQNNFLEEALKYHVYAIGIDGLICSGNVCFFPSSSVSSADKMANIHILMGHYIIIANNSLFEAGTWAIELFNVGQAIIDGNTIAWPGQRELNGGIMMTWGAQNNEPQVDNIISNNIIDSPTKYGVVILDNTENVTLLNDRIRNFGSSQHYYGSTPIGVSYAIATAGTAKNNQILNNVMTNNTGATTWITSDSVQTNNIKDNIFNNKPAPVLSVFTSKDNLNTWPVNYDVLNIANTQPTTVNHMDDGYEGQELLVRIFDGNTTLISDNHQVLKALTTRKLYVNEAIKFRYSFGQWVEI